MTVFQAKSPAPIVVGRNERGLSSIFTELDLLVETAQAADHFRVVAGSVGAGKTSVALRLAHELAHSRSAELAKRKDVPDLPRAIAPWQGAIAEPLGAGTPTDLVINDSRVLVPLRPASSDAQASAIQMIVWSTLLEPAQDDIDLDPPDEPKRAELARIDYLTGRLKGLNRADARNLRRRLRTYFDRVSARIGRAAKVVPLAPHEPCDLLPLRSALTPTAPPALAASRAAGAGPARPSRRS
ncbi:hypothetical protein FRACA_810003 [Frankia canadensis]|uniref:Uncharacterized protein n=1 Tax=Frankia canadensis TaxID=1836972 RepID=A0A2I2L1L5_9ACTN|nr:hypothetical protein FRACA_810003 [Frankia canadensis]SOU59102.1 hypothetical protein FRACA_810003 [Frankia canadensis]